MRLACMMLMAAGAVMAQNHDLGILVGVNGPASQTITTWGGPRIETNAGGNFQINYATQLKETKVGRLYLELPLLVGARSAQVVDSSISTNTQAGVYFTPGLRFNVDLTSRVSVYGTAGVGVAAFGNINSVEKAALNSFSADWTSSLAGAFGGGLDIRLSRLISLRAEGRDFIARRGIGLNDGRHHSVFSMGLGFHW